MVRVQVTALKQHLSFSPKGLSMTKSSTPTWIETRTDLPDWIAIGIGRIAIEFSEIEWQLEETIRVLMDTSVKFGRIITDGMPFRSRLEKVRHLLQAYVWDQLIDGDTLGKNFSSFEELAKDCGDVRNMYAHGLWGHRDGQWVVKRTSNVRDGDSLAPEIKKMARAVIAQPHVVTSEVLASHLEKIRKCRAQIQELRAHIQNALPPPNHKSPELHKDGEILPRLAKPRG